MDGETRRTVVPVAEIERKVLETLDKLGIPYVRHEHPPVATVEEAEKHWAGLKGTHCKNLFLRNYKGNRHYLVIAPVTRGIDLSLIHISEPTRRTPISYA